MYPGHRLLINAGRNRQTYCCWKRSRSSDISMQTASDCQGQHGFERAMYELDVELAGSDQRALQLEGAAISALIKGFTLRPRLRHQCRGRGAR